MNIKVDVTDAVAKLQELAAAMVQSVPAIVYETGVEIMQASLKQVPVDTGRLKLSGHVTMPTGHTLISCRAGYDTPYAKDQHDNMSYAHRNGGKAGFLVDPFGNVVGAQQHERIAAWVLQEVIQTRQPQPLMPDSNIPMYGPYDRGRAWQEAQRGGEAGRRPRSAASKPGTF